MNQEIQKVETSAQSQELSLTPEMQNLVYEVAIKGNLKNLKPEQKIQFVQAKCISLSIHPSKASECFEIIEFQGKEVLYPKKGFAEVVRDSRNVQCKVLSTNHDKESGLYFVKAQATLPNGRSEEALAVVDTSGKKGTDLANLIMKCETKAKRRVTLAICGLGLEERNFEPAHSYDVDDIPVKNAVLGQGNEEIDDWNKEPEVINHPVIDAGKVKELWTVASSQVGLEGESYPMPRWTHDQGKDLLLNKYGFKSSKDVTIDKFYEIKHYLATHAGHFSDTKGQVKIEEVSK